MGTFRKGTIQYSDGSGKKRVLGRGAVKKEKNRIVSQGYLEVTLLYYIKYDMIIQVVSQNDSSPKLFSRSEKTSLSFGM